MLLETGQSEIEHVSADIVNYTNKVAQSIKSCLEQTLAMWLTVNIEVTNLLELLMEIGGLVVDGLDAKILL